MSPDGVQPSRSMFATRSRRVSISSLRESAFCTSLRNWPHVGQAEGMEGEEREMKKGEGRMGGVEVKGEESKRG